jgi:hypothetical protein
VELLERDTELREPEHALLLDAVAARFERSEAGGDPPPVRPEAATTG